MSAGAVFLSPARRGQRDLQILEMFVEKWVAANLSKGTDNGSLFYFGGYGVRLPRQARQAYHTSSHSEQRS